MAKLGFMKIRQRLVELFQKGFSVFGEIDPDNSPVVLTSSLRDQLSRFESLRGDRPDEAYRDLASPFRRRFDKQKQFHERAESSGHCTVAR